MKPNLRRAATGCLKTASVGLALVSLTSCGGGSNGTNTTNSLTDQQISNALSAVDAKVKSLPVDQAHRDSTNQQLVTFFQQRSEFSAVAVHQNGTSVWAQLKNGQMVVIFNDLTASPMADSSKMSKLTQLTREIPDSSQARVLNALGNYYTPVAPTLTALLTAPGSGYQLAAGDASVNCLKKVKGDGLFFIESHGDSSAFATGYAMTTSTLITKKSDGSFTLEPQYADDWKNGLLVSSWAPQSKGPNGQPIWEARYAITDKFVRQYMSFGKNSFVLMQTCDSDTQSFRQACFDKGASVYAGWSRIVNIDTGDNEGIGDRASQYIVSQLLGDHNQQPAIDYSTIAKKLQDLGWNYDPTTGAKLNFTKGKDDFTQLAPSISNISYSNEPDPLGTYIVLGGTFGSDPGSDGKVMIGSTVLPQTNKVSWQPNYIIYKINGSVPGGTYKASVTVRNHQSNSMPVTIIPIPGPATYTYTGPSFDGFGPNRENNPYANGNKVTAIVTVDRADIYATVLSAQISDGIHTISIDNSGRTTFGLDANGKVTAWDIKGIRPDPDWLHEDIIETSYFIGNDSGETWVLESAYGEPFLALYTGGVWLSGRNFWSGPVSTSKSVHTFSNSKKKAAYRYAVPGLVP